MQLADKYSKAADVARRKGEMIAGVLDAEAIALEQDLASSFHKAMQQLKTIDTGTCDDVQEQAVACESLDDDQHERVDAQDSKSDQVVTCGSLDEDEHVRVDAQGSKSDQEAPKAPTDADLAIALAQRDDGRELKSRYDAIAAWNLEQAREIEDRQVAETLSALPPVTLTWITKDMAKVFTKPMAKPEFNARNDYGEDVILPCDFVVTGDAIDQNTPGWVHHEYGWSSALELREI
jgi:hypothetical protein